jgi:hypothetical protein
MKKFGKSILFGISGAALAVSGFATSAAAYGPQNCSGYLDHRSVHGCCRCGRSGGPHGLGLVEVSPYSFRRGGRWLVRCFSVATDRVTT